MFPRQWRGWLRLAGWATYSSAEACAAAIAPIEKVKSKTLPIIASVNDYKSIPQTQVTLLTAIGPRACVRMRTTEDKMAHLGHVALHS